MNIKLCRKEHKLASTSFSRDHQENLAEYYPIAAQNSFGELICLAIKARFFHNSFALTFFFIASCFIAPETKDVGASSS